MDRAKRAVGLKAYASGQPLDEFRSEGNRQFLALLAAYRCGGGFGGGGAGVGVCFRVVERGE
jgi:hypothetical protein